MALAGPATSTRGYGEVVASSTGDNTVHHFLRQGRAAFSSRTFSRGIGGFAFGLSKIDGRETGIRRPTC
jgi:hypothetical protein